MKENLKFFPLHHLDEARTKAAAQDELCWVLMRSLQNKVQQIGITSGERKRTEMKYGYEIAEHLFCEFFMPMKEYVSTIRGKRILHRKPAIPGMFFVRDSISNIRALASKGLGFELRFLKGRKYLEPVIISDKEMDAFISAVTGSAEVRFFSPDDKALNGAVGKHIRIIKNGRELDGHVMSIRGSKRRWLRISIKYCLAAYVEIDLEELKSNGQLVELLD